MSQGRWGRRLSSSFTWALCIIIISAEVPDAESCFLVLLGGVMWSTDNPLQWSNEDKRAFCVEKDSPPPSSLKAYHSRAEVWHHHFVSHLAVTWRATRSVTQRLTSASADPHLNTAVSGATVRKYVLLNHPSIFWGSETQGTVWLLIPSIPRILINWGLCPGQLVYLTVRQYTISLIDDWL